jgi:hypothetical protein
MKSRHTITVGEKAQHLLVTLARKISTETGVGVSVPEVCEAMCLVGLNKTVTARDARTKPLDNIRD